MSPARTLPTLALLPLLAAACAAPRSEAAERALTDATLDAWAAHVRPRPDELAWAELPWLPSFDEGLAEADARGRPLLLWVMNGHPLGCT